jgi:hypothetical protein
VTVKLDLLTPGVEVGLATTNLEADLPGGSQRRYTLGGSVLKLVTYSPPPPLPAAEYEVVESLAEFAPVPGMGAMFVADPDGNWIELFGTL